MTTMPFKSLDSMFGTTTSQVPYYFSVQQQLGELNTFFSIRTYKMVEFSSSGIVFAFTFNSNAFDSELSYNTHCLQTKPTSVEDAHYHYIRGGAYIKAYSEEDFYKQLKRARTQNLIEFLQAFPDDVIYNELDRRAQRKLKLAA
jgi:hypothetical protein